MTEKEELEIYRRLLTRISIGLSVFKNDTVRECLVGIRNWGYSRSNSTGDLEHDEKCRINAIKNLDRISQGKNTKP